MSDEVYLDEVESQSTGQETEVSVQTEMTGDFFDYDDGLGAVVNQDGEPYVKDDGKYYSSLDEYKNAQKEQPLQQQPQKPVQTNANAKPQQSSSPAQAVKPPVVAGSFESLYHKDNSFDINSVLNDAPKFNEFKYQSASMPQLGSTQQPEQPVQPPVDPKTEEANAIKEYRGGLESSILAPLQRTYEGIANWYIQQGTEIPPAVYQQFNSEYSRLKEAISELVDNKKEELREKRYASETESKQFEKLQADSLNNFDAISTRYFPDKTVDASRDRLSKLVFGYTGADGKFVRGYGADIVDHLFDMANSGKQYKNHQEWQNAYSKWWTQYASNPKNIEYIAQRSWDRFIAKSLPNIRDSYRSTWENEQREKLKQSQQKPAVSMGSSAVQTDDVQKQLDSYFTPPKRNL